MAPESGLTLEPKGIELKTNDNTNGPEYIDKA